MYNTTTPRYINGGLDNVDDPALNWIPPLPETEAKLSGRKCSYQPSTGGQTIKTYTCEKKEDVIALADYYSKNWGASYDIEEGATYKIIVNLPWDELTDQDYTTPEADVATWEIVPTAVQESILAQQIWNPVSGSYTYLPHELRNVVKEAYDKKGVIRYNTGSLAEYAQYTPVAQLALQLLRADIKGTNRYVITVKRSVTININDETDWGNENKLNVYYDTKLPLVMSKEAMITTYNIKPKIYGRMLPSYKKRINDTKDSIPIYSYAGYLIERPTYQFLTSNKVSITQNFYWNEYVSNLYAFVGAAADFPLKTI